MPEPSIDNVLEFLGQQNMCRQLQNGVQALFGPSDALLGPHVQSICEALDVPHMESRLDLELNSKEFSVNLYPSQKLLNAAFKDVIRFLNWTKVAIVYEEDNGLFKLQELVKTPPTLKTEMYIRHANPSTYRNVLREIRQKEIFNLIIDTSTTHISQFFRA
ncbi:glutamate receptor ionotropic, kainate 2-like, partial [Diaphorina citri]|uniref:Glutamate receptor ionotropic, kainate 2-like n=1 Tax=Diaphorina citri TaxID=121845 RepID=A0A1S3DGP5_DIACI